MGVEDVRLGLSERAAAPAGERWRRDRGCAKTGGAPGLFYLL